MKKQFFYSTIFLLAAISFCNQNKNSIKACAKNLCSNISEPINRETKLHIPSYAGDDAEAPFEILMNPFIKL